MATFWSSSTVAKPAESVMRNLQLSSL
jgi:hypothetical protein